MVGWGGAAMWHHCEGVCQAEASPIAIAEEAAPAEEAPAAEAEAAPAGVWTLPCVGICVGAPLFSRLPSFFSKLSRAPCKEHAFWE